MPFRPGDREAGWQLPPSLDTLLPANSGWALQDAHGINDLGQIVGYGINPDGNQHAYLLSPLSQPPTDPPPAGSPVPEPSTIVLAMLAGTAFLFRNRA